MSPSTGSDDRKRELQADRALFGLTDAEARELASLTGDHSSDVPDELELAAAALDVGLSAGDDEPLPEHLRQQILAASRSYSAPVAAPSVAPSSPASVTLGASLPERGDAPAARRRELLAWLAAAAATIVAVIMGTRGVAEPTPVRLRQRLLAQLHEQPDAVVQVAWTRGEDEAAAAAEGDVIWSDRDQAGVMRFHGLAANDPTKTQYQLWIFDPAQDERYPIDGGVFNVPAGVDEVLVPIDAKLPVANPTLFAITIEKPGGVVVSDRSRLPLLAQVEP